MDEVRQAGETDPSKWRVIHHRLRGLRANTPVKADQVDDPGHLPVAAQIRPAQRLRLNTRKAGMSSPSGASPSRFRPASGDGRR